tara:strand:+ start:682 stop:4260 length:3579 start_codon:yes stop_codon:yes gene_type:complete
MPTFSPKQPFSISGKNLNFISDVKFGDLFVEDLSYMDTTGISGTIPAAAYTTGLYSVTSRGEFLLGYPNILLNSDDQVSVGKLPSVSGKAGDSMNITGSNFYQITDVKFGSVSGSFELVDENTIEAQVPQNADYTGITVFSSIRTGLNDNTALASGISIDEFFSVPEVSGLKESQLVSGETISITGFSLKGVTGIKYANDASLVTGLSLTDTNTLEGIVPSGNIRGEASLLLPSGKETSLGTNFLISPFAKVTGVGGSVVGVSSEKPVGSTGSLLLVSGDNFVSGILSPTGDNYLGTIMGQTTEFKLISDKVLSGAIPTGIIITTSGGNIGIPPVISSGVVNLFSDNFPESYPSDVYFTPSIGLPKITSIAPSSGVMGDTVSIKGNDLYGITGVNFLPSASANVGIGTYDAGTVAEVVPGFELSFEIGSSSTLGTAGEPYDVVLSGFYGSVTGVAGFFCLGTPSISSIDPSSNVVPGVTGLVEGSRLYSGSYVELWTGENNMGTYEYFKTLPSSGYDTVNHDTIEFTYPNAFTTGVKNYKIRVKNRRSTTPISNASSPLFVPFRTPFFSGFDPLSGEFGDTITVSGYFEDLYAGGLSIGNVNAPSFNKPDTTGFNFVIPNNSSSDLINISTSGGSISSSGLLQVIPSKPSISGFYSGTASPAVINYEQVFKGTDTVTVSGERMDLVTGVLFSGSTGSFVKKNFNTQGYSSINFDAPGAINPLSGKFKLLDFLGRETESNSTGIKVVHVSGFSNYLLPAETMDVTGFNISGMDILFPYATGGFTGITPFSTSLVGDGSEKVSLQLPTGVVFGALEISGRENRVAVDNQDFKPLGVITGISSSDLVSGEIESGKTISVTGINIFSLAMTTGDNVLPTGFSGVSLMGFSGTQSLNIPLTEGASGDSVFPDQENKIQQLEIDSYTTGIGSVDATNDVFYSKIDFRFPPTLMATGNLFLIDPWWATVEDEYLETYRLLSLSMGTQEGSMFSYGGFIFPDSGTYPQSYTNLNNKISYFPEGVKSTGIVTFVSGYGPVLGAAGDLVRVSGSGLNFVEDVLFESYQNGEQTSAVSFTGTSTELEIIVPTMPNAHLGGNAIILRGNSPEVKAYHTGITTSGIRTGFGDGTPLSTFNYFVKSEGVAYDASPVSAGYDLSPVTPVGGVVNYTAEEEVDGTIFLVTRTKFPDGSTLIVSSVPKS